MGEAAPKFRQWAGFEFGTAVGSLPGNCEGCEKAHRQLKLRTPCETKCPKYKLYPGETRGLHPKNALAVQLYGMATRDVRVGMSGILTGTLAPADAWAVIRVYSMHMANAAARQRCFELMTLLDRVVTEKRFKSEQRERERMNADLENRVKNRKRR